MTASLFRRPAPTAPMLPSMMMIMLLLLQVFPSSLRIASGVRKSVMPAMGQNDTAKSGPRRP